MDRFVVVSVGLRRLLKSGALGGLTEDFEEACPPKLLQLLEGVQYEQEDQEKDRKKEEREKK
jgi:hypothetical protein